MQAAATVRTLLVLCLSLIFIFRLSNKTFSIDETNLKHQNGFQVPTLSSAGARQVTNKLVQAQKNTNSTRVLVVHEYSSIWFGTRRTTSYIHLHFETFGAFPNRWALIYLACQSAVAPTSAVDFGRRSLNCINSRRADGFIEQIEAALTKSRYLQSVIGFGAGNRQKARPLRSFAATAIGQ